MKSIQSAYQELINLTQLYLLREHSRNEVRHVDPALLDYFKGRPLKPPSPLPLKVETKFPPNTPPQQFSLQPTPSQPRIIENPAERDGSKPHPTHQVNPNVESTTTVEVVDKEKTLQPIVQNVQQPPSAPPVQEKPAAAQTTLPSSLKNEWKEKRLTLEPFPPAIESDQTQWWKICRELFNGWPLQEAIPSDTLAKKSSQAWLQSKETAPITLLSFNDNPQQLLLLKNIAQAISLRLAPAQVISAPKIENENGWEALLHSPQLRLVIASDYGLYLHPKLMEFHRENAQQHKHFLHNTPFLLLSDLSLYLKQPKLKPLLWRAICNEFFALPPPSILKQEP